jgi:hypothetical protein
VQDRDDFIGGGNVRADLDLLDGGELCDQLFQIMSGGLAVLFQEFIEQFRILSGGRSG